jgi:crotonobetainyl-CoA:carnitine CoA-transferase CaiB-like acyl-CoA transferase
MERYGLGYQDIRALKPDIIYCSLTGFGHTGPKAHHPAYDVVIQAYSGLMAANGLPNQTPVRVGPAVLDYGTGAYAAFAISSALFQRSRTGTGQFIDVAMSDAALMLMSNSVMITQARGQTPAPFGNAHPKKPGYSAYSTTDGLLMLGAFTLKQLRCLLRVIGRDDLCDELASASSDELSQRHDEICEILTHALKIKTAGEWEQILNNAGVPAAKVRRIDEVINTDQIRSRNILQEAATIPESGAPLQVPVAAFHYEHGGPSLTSPSPRLGEHTIQILSELGYTSQNINEFIRTKTVYHS